MKRHGRQNGRALQGLPARAGFYLFFLLGFAGASLADFESPPPCPYTIAQTAGHRGYSIALQNPAFTSSETREVLARQYGPKLAKPTHSADAYERRALAFARSKDLLTVTSLSQDWWGRQSYWKLHLGTGELLVVSPALKIGVFARLKQGPNGLGPFYSWRQLSQFFSQSIGVDGQEPGTTARVTAGEDLGKFQFPGFQSMHRHFLKHVLGAPPDSGLEGTHWRQAASSFPALKEAFLKQYDGADPARRKHLIGKWSHLYAKLAADFASSASPSALCITRREAWTNRHGTVEHARISIKFDPVTLETVIVNRDNGNILSYFTALPRDAAQERLRRFNPTWSIESLLEYFLVYYGRGERAR